ncbi:MAG: beta-propeller domain-containing protein [Nitrosopumilus sp.]|nr:beta-propeller domain-containing protein [Nitrosopumilus sp.]
MGSVDARVAALAIGIAVVATAGAMYAVYSGTDTMAGPAGAAPVLEPAPEPTPAPEPEPAQEPEPREDPEPRADPAAAASGDGPRRITSVSHLEEILAERGPAAGFGVIREGRGADWMTDDVLVLQEGIVEFAESSRAASAGPAGAQGHSTTNVQVAGVDETDYIKNDGTHAYMVEGGILYVIRAHPPGSAEIVYRAALDSELRDSATLLLDGDRLAVIYGGDIAWDFIPEFGYEPRSRSAGATNVMLLDITDRGSPRIVKELAVEGNLEEARMSGGTAYVLTSTYVDAGLPAFPSVLENGDILVPEAFYFDGQNPLETFNVITAMDMDGGESRSETYLTGGADATYVAADAMYISYTEHGRQDDGDGSFFGAVVPLLPQHIRDEIGAAGQREWNEISEILQGWYNTMDDEERGETLERIREAVERYEGRGEDTVRTVIHRIGIDGLETSYGARGEVPGRLLNQFSMDQRDGMLRVATTTERDAGGAFERANAVYVLDGDMGVAGSLEGIAKNESIFAARFLGERLYLVTFERIDPFFVIDMSSTTPRVLGELKLPGYSDYLHPYGPDHVIGVGRDADENTGRELGVKVALFDVSDVSDPVVAGDFIFERDTDSDALRDHKAFYLQDGMLSIPVRTYSGSTEYAFHLFGVDDDITERGKIEHPADGRQDGRTFHIGDSLYTVYGGLVRMTDRGDLADIGSLSLRSGGLAEFLE